MILCVDVQLHPIAMDCSRSMDLNGCLSLGNQPQPAEEDWMDQYLDMCCSVGWPTLWE